MYAFVADFILFHSIVSIFVVAIVTYMCWCHCNSCWVCCFVGVIDFDDGVVVDIICDYIAIDMYVFVVVVVATADVILHNVLCCYSYVSCYCCTP